MARMQTLWFACLLLLTEALVARRSSTGTLVPLLSHRRVAERQRRRNLQAAEQVAELFQGFGTHYVDMWCGSPSPQRQTLVVNTGVFSDRQWTVFPCDGCEDGCDEKHIDAVYNTNKSSSFRKLDCSECSSSSSCNEDTNECESHFDISCGSGWSAVEAIDTCYLGGPHDRPVVVDDGATPPAPFRPLSFNHTFGCATKAKGWFRVQLADGELNMGKGPLSLWSQMYEAGAISSKSFSLCFSRNRAAERSGTESGAMSLGGYDERLHTTPMVYSAPQNSSQNAYIVQVRKIHLRAGGGGISVCSSNSGLEIRTVEHDGAPGNFYVDSATTDTYLHRSLQAPFEALYEDMMNKPFDQNEHKSTLEELAKEPTILLQLVGDRELNQERLDASLSGTVPGLAGDIDWEHPLDIVLAIPPEHYYEFDDHKGAYANRFHFTNSNAKGIIGANALMGHDVLFNNEADQLGWAEANCDYTALLADSGVVAPTTGGKSANSAALSGVCHGSLWCQMSVWFVIAGAVAMIVVRTKRASPVEHVYDPIADGFELQDFADDDRSANSRPIA